VEGGTVDHAEPLTTRQGSCKFPGRAAGRVVTAGADRRDPDRRGARLCLVRECGVDLEPAGLLVVGRAQPYGAAVAVDDEPCKAAGVLGQRGGTVSLVVVYAISGRECAGVCPGRISTGVGRSLVGQAPAGVASTWRGLFCLLSGPARRL
jgi:hypothetical protein